jgi:hypothetical protein
MRRGQAVDGDDRRPLARPEAVRELDLAGPHAPYQLALWGQTCPHLSSRVGLG